MATGIRLEAETLQTIAAGALVVGSYVSIGEPFENSDRIIIIQNLTDQSVLFSFDGTTDNFMLPTMSGLVLDVCANRNNVDQGLYFHANALLYAKPWSPSNPPTTGSLIVSGFYGA